MPAVDAPTATVPVAMRPPCSRCGRIPSADEADPRGEEMLCAACWRSDLSRCAGQPAFDYSPFRPLLSPS